MTIHQITAVLTNDCEIIFSKSVDEGDDSVDLAIGIILAR